MHERQRHVDPHPTQQSPATTDGHALHRMRQQATEFAAAADAIIASALSEDSEEFLRANRQQGGQ